MGSFGSDPLRFSLRMAWVQAEGVGTACTGGGSASPGIFLLGVAGGGYPWGTNPSVSREEGEELASRFPRSKFCLAGSESPRSSGIPKR
jgi:hypothetical protein